MNRRTFLGWMVAVAGGFLGVTTPSIKAETKDSLRGRLSPEEIEEIRKVLYSPQYPGWHRRRDELWEKVSGEEVKPLEALIKAEGRR